MGAVAQCVSPSVGYADLVLAVDVLIVRLKGGTGGILALCRVGRSYGDFLGGAIAFTVVIHAVLNVAANALDMVAAATASLFGHDGFFLFMILRDSIECIRPSRKTIFLRLSVFYTANYSMNGGELPWQYT